MFKHRIDPTFSVTIFNRLTVMLQSSQAFQWISPRAHQNKRVTFAATPEELLTFPASSTATITDTLALDQAIQETINTENISPLLSPNTSPADRVVKEQMISRSPWNTFNLLQHQLNAMKAATQRTTQSLQRFETQLLQKQKELLEKQLNFGKLLLKNTFSLAGLLGIGSIVTGTAVNLGLRAAFTKFVQKQTPQLPTIKELGLDMAFAIATGLITGGSLGALLERTQIKKALRVTQERLNQSVWSPFSVRPNPGPSPLNSQSSLSMPSLDETPKMDLESLPPPSPEIA